MRAVVVGSFVFVAACTPKEPVEIGASCSAASKVEACAIGKLALCSGGKWHETTACPGERGCYRQGVGHGSTAPICDDAVARAGNVCATGGQQLCSTDRRARLVCEGGRWRVQTTCAEACSWDSSGIVCR